MDPLLNDSKQWDDFAQSAGCPPEGPDNKAYVPYILVHSISQETLERTEHIDVEIKTQLASTTWEQLKSCFLVLADLKGVIPKDFLVLDHRSL